MGEPVADIGLIGLAVMGQNLILNMNDNGFIVCAYNRTTQKVDEFLKNEAKGTEIVGAHSLEEMVKKLKKPRRVMMLVKAGIAVDSFINQLIPLLEPGDIIIDGGNSEYTDTQRRCKYLKEKNLLFIGAGISGGEEGARYGPSIMPGGHLEAWKHVKNIFQKISAKVDGQPCCDWVGEDGAGHYVKMVHNGIEYGDMQLCSEAYSIMKNALDLNHDEMSKAFEQWNKTELESFLIEITADILKYKQDGEYLVTKIRDSAGQKGTGKWTAISALDLGVPVTLIGESVFSRCLSSLKEERSKASKLFSVKKTQYTGNKQEFVEHIRRALYASKIISYVQGFMLLKEAAKKFNWNLDYGKIALMWRGGCIIRSVFLGNIKKAFDKDKNLENLLFDEFFKSAIIESEQSLRLIVSEALKIPITVPCFSAAAAFFVGYTSDILPANLIQAQRDYFGAHGYELLDKPDIWVHTNWTVASAINTLIDELKTLSRAGGYSGAWNHLQNIFHKISAKLIGEPHCDWLSQEEAANFVKMVKNGITDCDMHLYSEAYDLLNKVLHLNQEEIIKIFKEWSNTELDLSLITSDILNNKHKESDAKIDAGKLTAISALDLGVPVTLIGESVFSRCLSSLKEERVKASNILPGPKQTQYTGNKEEFLEHVRRALYASKIISYAQSFMLLKEAAKKYNWKLDYGKIALTWRNRFLNGSVFLDKVRNAFDKNLENLLFDDFFKNEIIESEQSLRLIVSEALKIPVAVPCFSAAAAFFVGYTSDILPANLIQAQRDYFGAHGYELLDKPDIWVHTNWTGKGGNVSSSAYNA